MPIANCYILSSLDTISVDESELISLWASKSNISSDEMTVNLIEVNKQVGKKYSVVAQLLLPSMWSRPKVSSLQTSLANAFSQCYKVPLEQVIVTTNIVESGLVVESGREVNW
jgi:hypothetical protein